MADKIILSEAAKILNIDVERLQFLSRTGEIHGIKNADQTAFTYQELQRYADVNGIDIPEAHASDSSSLFDDDSVLVDETPMSSVAGGSGTVIGDEANVNPHDSDLNLADSIDLETDEFDELHLDLDGGDSDSEDQTRFGGDDNQGFSASDIAALNLDDEGIIESDDATQFGAGEEVNLGEEVLDLDLGGSNDDETLFAIGDDGFKVAGDELVLGGEEMPLNPTVGLSAGNSGINLSNPHDSGISLDDMLDLSDEGGSSLELPGVDDEFVLGGKPEDEMSDSGSQIIALSDSVAFEDATNVHPEALDPFAIPADSGADPFGIPAGAGADPFGIPADSGADPFVIPQSAVADPFGPEAPMASAAMDDEFGGGDIIPVMQEASYGFFNVFSLFMVFSMQVAIFVMLIDLIKNLWGHHAETPSSISTTLIEAAVELKNGQNAWMILSIAAIVFFIAIIVGWILDRGRNK